MKVEWNIQNPTHNPFLNLFFEYTKFPFSIYHYNDHQSIRNIIFLFFSTKFQMSTFYLPLLSSLLSLGQEIQDLYLLMLLYMMKSVSYKL